MAFYTGKGCPIMLQKFRAVFIAIVFLSLAGCGDRVCDVTGVWEGEAGQSLLVFKFKPDGAANISVTSGSQMSTTYCRWALVERRISISNNRGQVRWFAIVEYDDDELVLRIDSGPAGLCRLHRTDRT